MGGFTLLELLAALAILAAALTIALPALTTDSSSEILAAARTVAAGLRQTRERAIITNKAAVMGVDVEARQIALDGRMRQLPQWIRVGLFTAKSERTGASSGAIRFFPNGGSTGGRVTLEAAGRGFRVDVDWLTGRVSILEGGAEDWEAPTAFEVVRIE